MTILRITLSLALLALAGCATPESTTTTRTTAVSTEQHGTYVRQNRPFKIIGGKRYVFIPAELGSNVPARWVPEDSPAAQNAPATQTVDPQTIQNLPTGGQH